MQTSSIRYALPIALLLSIAAPMAGQPFLFYRGIVNAASSAAPGLPNGAIARGSIFTLYGRNLGPPATASASSFPLGDSLAGVTIEVCREAACVNAIPLYVSPAQINAIMPSNAPLGGASARVRFNNQTGNFTPIEVVAASPGIFAINSAGFGPGVITNFVTQENQPVNSPAVPATPGQVITIWLTGLGAGFNADNVLPQTGDLPVPVEVFVGGKLARKLYSGRSGCCAGLDQVVIEIPQNAPLGCYVPVAIRAAGAVISNDITIALSANGSACSDPGDTVGPALRAGGRFGSIAATRFRIPVPGGPEVGSDTAWARFIESPAGPFTFQPDHITIPAGTCLTFAGRGAGIRAGTAILAPPATRELDAGANVTVQRAGDNRLVFPQPAGLRGYLDFLGVGGIQPSTAILDPPGEITLGAPGGADVAAFAVPVTPPPTPTWTNIAASAIVNRSQDTQLTFTPSADPTVSTWIAGAARRPEADAEASFLCRVPAGQSSFTVPAYVLGRLPAAAGPIDSFLAVVFQTGRLAATPPAGLDLLQATASSAATEFPEYR